jgi:hypothetical protein
MRAAAAEHGIAADRFAREIVGILKAHSGALAAAECQTVSPQLQTPSTFSGVGWTLMRDTPRLDIPVLIKISVILFVLFGGFVIYRLVIPSDQPERNGDPLDLRGTTIIVLRMPDSLAPSQRVAFYEEGSVIRFFIPFNAATSQKTQLVLSTEEQRGVQAFRARWCATPQQLIQPTTGHPSYDIAVRCDDPHIKQAVIPVEQLPPILRDILQRLPALPHEQ